MEYEVARPARCCSVSGREFQPGETFYSVLVDTVTGLVRHDISTESWEGPPDGTVGFWQYTVPEETTKNAGPKPVSVEEMLAMFEKLAGSTDSEKLRYVLALLLVQRKALKLQGIEERQGQEYLLLRRSRSKIVFEVIDPQLDDDQIQAVETELMSLLSTANEE